MQIVIIIAIVLIVGIGAYFLGINNGSKIKNSCVITGNIDQVIGDDNQILKDSYSNVSLGYSLEYPKDWVMNENGNILTLKNSNSTILPGANSNLGTSDSYVQIEVTNNMNYSDYKEFIKDPKYVSAKVAAERISNLKAVNIGGKDLQVFTGMPTTDNAIVYSFIYNKKLYSINFNAGSRSQFDKDEKVFKSLMSSFQFLN